MKKHFEKALAYVREHKTWSEARETLAWENMDDYRCPLSMADTVIVDEIHDLMEEYSEENELPEEWWYEFSDEDEIFEKL